MTLKTIFKRLRAFHRNTEGAVAIEMAFTFSVISIMVIGTFDISNQILDQRKVEEIARAGLTLALQDPSLALDANAIMASTYLAAGSSADDIEVETASFCRCFNIDLGDFGPKEENCGGFCPDGDLKPLFAEVTVYMRNEPVLSYPGLLTTRVLVGRAVIQAQ